MVIEFAASLAYRKNCPKGPIRNASLKCGRLTPRVLIGMLCVSRPLKALPELALCVATHPRGAYGYRWSLTPGRSFQTGLP